MNTYSIYLNDINKIKDFVKVADSLNCRLELISGSYIVDGKSVMGLFSLDLSKAIVVKVIQDNPEAINYSEVLEEFLA
jgi:phosphotransferase system HPr-like phosphotransfer protein